jgi:hypothetical protein
MELKAEPGHARVKKFEVCFRENVVCELSQGSDISKDEILTPAQRFNHLNVAPKLARNDLDLETTREGKSAASDPLKRVIIIEPVAAARPVEKFFANDLAFSKALADFFDRARIAKFNKKNLAGHSSQNPSHKVIGPCVKTFLMRNLL